MLEGIGGADSGHGINPQLGHARPVILIKRYAGGDHRQGYGDIGAGRLDGAGGRRAAACGQQASARAVLMMIENIYSF